MPTAAVKGLDIEVTVSSVNLSGDCPDPVVAQPAAPTAVPPEAKPEAKPVAKQAVTANSVPAPQAVPASPPAFAASEAESSSVAGGARLVTKNCTAPGCGIICQQSSMQLALSAKGSGAATKVEIVKVELLDAGGAVLGELKARNAQTWVEAAGNYQAWDALVKAPGDLKASYALTAPDWSKVPGGRYGGGTGLAVRVTLAIGDARVMKTATAVSVIVDPEVVT